MNSIVNSIQNLHSLLRKDLSAEKQLLEKLEHGFLEEKFEKKVIFSHYIRKCCFCYMF